MTDSDLGATKSTVWRSGSPNRTFIVRQNWIALSEKVSGWPCLAVFLACQPMSGSNQTDNEP